MSALLETRFDPKQHGFRFSNNDTVWNVPGTPIHGQFLCGGMVYTALDYFYGHKTIPQRTTAPPINHKLNRYIIERQNAAHVRTVSRMTVFAFLHDWFVESVAGEFDLIRKGIEAGKPVPLFLLKKEFLHGHHVLVTACRSTPSAAGPFLFVYDPNYPEKTSTIARWGDEKTFSLNCLGKGQSFLKGFFVDTNYAVHRPPDDLDPQPPPPARPAARPSPASSTDPAARPGSGTCRGHLHGSRRRQSQPHFTTALRHAGALERHLRRQPRDDRRQPQPHPPGPGADHSALTRIARRAGQTRRSKSAPVRPTMGHRNTRQRDPWAR